MRRSSLRNGWAARLLLQRIDRAAARTTPYLVVLAAGLALLNLVCLSLLALHVPVTRHSPQQAGAAQSGCIIPAADAALRTGS